MSRPLRIEYKGAWYHIYNRGAGRRRIFIDQRDYELFFELLKEILETWNVQTHAFSLLPNHYHLAIHTPNAGLSRAIRHLSGVYTQRFNRRHKTDGPLFRGRFKSKAIEKDGYLIELVRYIHLNPVKAGLAEKPREHPWTSHRACIGKGRKMDWLFTEEVLSYFGGCRARAARKFDMFVNDKSSGQINFADERRSVLGSDGFMEWIRYNFIDNDKSSDEIPEVRRLARKETDLDDVLNCVASFYGMAKIDVLGSSSGRKNEARKVAVYLMKRLTGADYKDIANVMGKAPKRSVSQLNHRFQKELLGNDQLRERCNTLALSLMSNVKT